MFSSKAKTNRKWTSTEKYRNNYDKIFKKTLKQIEEEISVAIADLNDPADADKIAENTKESLEELKKLYCESIIK